jgi:hypothetical protein
MLTNLNGTKKILEKKKEKKKENAPRTLTGALAPSRRWLTKASALR